MTDASTGLAAAGITVAFAILLALSDRKRRGPARASSLRLAALIGALAPAAWAALAGLPAALIWFGASAIGCWLATLLVNAGRNRRSRS